MALTDAQRLQMTALALMRYSVVRYNTDISSLIGVPVGRPIYYPVQIVSDIIGAPAQIE